MRGLEHRLHVGGLGGMSGSGGGAQTQGVQHKLVISVADWEGGTTVEKEIAEVTETSIVIVDTSDGNVECTAQGNGTLTFTATETPSDPVVVKVVVFPSNQPADTCSISLSLPGCTGSNPATSVEVAEAYENIITPDTGYLFDSVIVSMGGTDITSTAWDPLTKKVHIDLVSGDIVIVTTVIRKTEATITKTLAGCKDNNSATVVNTGASYENTFTANIGYTLSGASIVVTMGGIDVTDEVFDRTLNKIVIPEVEDDIVITITAIEAPKYEVTISRIDDGILFIKYSNDNGLTWHDITQTGYIGKMSQIKFLFKGNKPLVITSPTIVPKSPNRMATGYANSECISDNYAITCKVTDIMVLNN